MFPLESTGVNIKEGVLVYIPGLYNLGVSELNIEGVRFLVVFNPHNVNERSNEALGSDSSPPRIGLEARPETPFLAI